MMDAFAELGLPRSPVINEDAVARQFDALSRERHPDAGGEAAAFARLGEARAILLSPAKRLRHLLTLLFPTEKLDGPLPPPLLDLFAALGPDLAAAKDVLARKASAASALSRALLAPQEMALREKLEARAESLAARQAALLDEASRWEGQPASLAALAREAAFLEKWQAQLRDFLARLGL